MNKIKYMKNLLYTIRNQLDLLKITETILGSLMIISSFKVFNIGNSSINERIAIFIILVSIGYTFIFHAIFSKRVNKEEESKGE